MDNLAWNPLYDIGSLKTSYDIYTFKFWYEFGVSKLE
jgi:hypothetical protein